MAERRMFAKTIILSDAFLDMPMSARCLYFTLGMLADDDGFVNSPKSIMRQCGASQDDMNVLISKKFVIIFDSGVVVIKHWRIHNYLRSDRYNMTKYTAEKSQLSIEENGAYNVVYQVDTSGIPDGIPDDGKRYTQDRLGKDRLGKVRKGKDKTVWFPNDEALNEAFDAFIVHRKRLNKPITEYACELAVKKLNKLSNGDNDLAIKIIRQSIDEGWQGFYELKIEKKQTTTEANEWAEALKELENGQQTDG